MGRRDGWCWKWWNAWNGYIREDSLKMLSEMSKIGTTSTQSLKTRSEIAKLSTTLTQALKARSVMSKIGTTSTQTLKTQPTNIWNVQNQYHHDANVENAINEYMKCPKSVPSRCKRWKFNKHLKCPKSLLPRRKCWKRYLKCWKICTASKTLC